MSYNPNHLQDNWAGADAAYHEEKLARAEAEASKWFNQLSKPQSARYNQRMADAAPYKNSPRWDRERLAAEREFRETTPEARRICELVMQDMMVLGEPSEATFFAIDEVSVAQMKDSADQWQIRPEGKEALSRLGTIRHLRPRPSQGRPEGRS